jgi:transcriptional regulator with XRE-family HTH domain
MALVDSSPQPVPRHDGDTDQANLPIMSERLRAARIRAGLTARQLAAELGCSPSLISQIERGKATPSVGRLYAMTTALGISMNSLFPESAEASRPLASRQAESSSDIVLRHADRPAIDLEHDVRWERLTPRSERNVEFREVFYEVGGGSPDSERAIQHNGRDYAVIIEGCLSVQVGFERFVLRPGDSIAFDATVPHQFWNQGEQRVRAVFVLINRDLRSGEIE